MITTILVEEISQHMKTLRDMAKIFAEKDFDNFFNMGIIEVKNKMELTTSNAIL